MESNRDNNDGETRLKVVACVQTRLSSEQSVAKLRKCSGDSALAGGIYQQGQHSFQLLGIKHLIKGCKT